MKFGMTELAGPSAMRLADATARLTLTMWSMECDFQGRIAAVASTVAVPIAGP
jgi:hypothetical protein